MFVKQFINLIFVLTFELNHRLILLIILYLTKFNGKMQNILTPILRIIIFTQHIMN